MLVLGRKPGERIMIGADVEVVVCGVKDGQVRLGIEAPKEVPIRRGELGAAPPGGRGTKRRSAQRAAEPPPSWGDHGLVDPPILTRASRIRISHIVRTPGFDHPWDRIESIGGRGPGGAVWELARDDAIARIEDGAYHFFVEDGDRAIDVIVATLGGHKYLKTEADGQHPDHLLALPELPSTST